jgi:hypothetical protein
LIDLTTLIALSSETPLLIYVAASHPAVSAALVQEKQDGQIKKKALVYFISEVLSPSKKNYTELEKVLYAVLMASRKLTLLPSISHNSAFITTPDGHNDEQRSYMKGQKMGRRTQLIHH